MAGYASGDLQYDADRPSVGLEIICQAYRLLLSDGLFVGIKNAIERIRPKLILLAELELWPNMVRIAKNRGVKIAVVNGRLSERSFRGYGHIGWLTRNTLRRIDWIAVQDRVYGERFEKTRSQRFEHYYHRLDEVRWS